MQMHTSNFEGQGWPLVPSLQAIDKSCRSESEGKESEEIPSGFPLEIKVPPFHAQELSKGPQIYA